jgi:hypothetical protein
VNSARIVPLVLEAHRTKVQPDQLIDSGLGLDYRPLMPDDGSLGLVYRLNTQAVEAFWLQSGALRHHYFPHSLLTSEANGRGCARATRVAQDQKFKVNKALGWHANTAAMKAITVAHRRLMMDRAYSRLTCSGLSHGLATGVAGPMLDNYTRRQGKSPERVAERSFHRT